jgi:hypothetical protein
VLPAEQAVAELVGVRAVIAKHHKLLLLCYTYCCACSQGSAADAAFTMDVASFKLFIQVRLAAM